MKNIGLIVICLLFITFSEAKPQFINHGMPWSGLFNATAIGDIVHIGGYPSVLGSNANYNGGWSCHGCNTGSQDYFGK